MTSPFCRNRPPRFTPAPSYPLLNDVLPGLQSSHKTLPAKLFYDARGAELFEQICELPEYYLTRAELEILHQHADDIAALAGPRCALIEYGSGAGVKIRLLLDALRNPAAYVPIDISGEQLDAVATELSSAYPGVAIRPVLADYTAPFALPTLPPDSRKVAFFPGSTIGNFHPTEAAAFLRRIRRTVGRNGALILGVDRVKDARVFDAAYDDAAGVTAAFNLNILARLNHELNADFDLTQFRHLAFFDPEARRVEMHLVSEEPQVAHVAEVPVVFDEGESIWTESSYKYDEERLGQLAENGGFSIERIWTDHRNRFWVVFLTASALTG